VVETILRFSNKTIGGETLHRSFLVTDERDGVVGVICFSDLLRALRPTASKSPGGQTPMAESAYLDQAGYLRGFITAVQEIAPRRVGELKLTKPPVVAADADLMDVLEKLTSSEARNLFVREDGKIVGVLREKDLFLEMVNIIRCHQEGQFLSTESFSDDRN
jgi:CBS domain-containing protein